MASESDNPAAAAAKLGENMAAQLANAANVYGGAYAGSFKAVQDYQAKLLHFFQTNAEANMQLAQKLMDDEVAVGLHRDGEFAHARTRRRDRRSGQGTRRARPGDGEKGDELARAAQEQLSDGFSPKRAWPGASRPCPSRRACAVLSRSRTS